jgi:hypothetical protein
MNAPYNLPNLGEGNLNLDFSSSNLPNGNGNVNGNSNGNTNTLSSDSFFDNALFGGLTPTIGLNGMDGTNEDDLWTQLFGTFP